MKIKAAVRRAERPFESGQPILRSGRFQVSHTHGGPLEVRMLSGKRFPHCASCDEPVFFTAVSWLATESALDRFRFLAK